MKIYQIAGIGLLAALHLLPMHAQQSHVNIDWAPQKNTENLVPLSLIHI